jgi:hypothetical protein
MNTYIIGFRQKGNRYGKVIREQTVEAKNASDALMLTYTDRAARAETWKVIYKRAEGNTFEQVITIDEYRANINDIDLSKV